MCFLVGKQNWGVRYRLYLFFRVMCKVYKFDFYQKKITSGVLKNDILIVGERNSFKRDFFGHADKLLVLISSKSFKVIL